MIHIVAYDLKRQAWLIPLLRFYVMSLFTFVFVVTQLHLTTKRYIYILFRR